MKNRKFYFLIFISLFAAFLLGLFIVISIRNNNAVDFNYNIQAKNLIKKQRQDVIDKYGTEGLINIRQDTPGDSSSDEVLYDENNFRFIVLDVGQASCNIISCGDHHMIFDGGDRLKSSFVVSYVQKTLGINNFDYVIASHYDADHISGLIGILNKCSAENIFGPAYETDTKTYYSFISAAERAGGLTYPEIGKSYELGDAVFTFISPTKFYEDENSNSLGIEIKYGNTSYLVMGDATTETENDSIESGLIHPVDILVLNHHGSASSTSNAFIEATNPKTIAISVGADNDYNQPAKSTLAKISDYPVLRTDENGTISFISDGNKIDIFTEK